MRLARFSRPLLTPGIFLAKKLSNPVAAGGGAGRPDLSNTFLQPFLAYNTKAATTFSLNTAPTTGRTGSGQSPST